MTHPPFFITTLIAIVAVYLIMVFTPFGTWYAHMNVAAWQWIATQLAP